MEDALQNQLNMINACLSLAGTEEHTPTWTNQEPLDFATDLAVLQTLYDAAMQTAQKAQTPIKGTTQAKADAETALEDSAFRLACALRNHFTKTGDMENCAKVNYTEPALRALRHQDLVTISKTIRDCGTSAVSHPDAVKRGVTQAKVDALSAAILAFSELLNAPRVKISDRAALNRELVTQVAACVSHIEAMDDLIMQFGGTPAGDRFVMAWKQARIVIDAGHGPSEPPAPPTPPPAH